jgi:hypothetical protein
MIIHKFITQLMDNIINVKLPPFVLFMTGPKGFPTRQNFFVIST